MKKTISPALPYLIIILYFILLFFAAINVNAQTLKMKSKGIIYHNPAAPVFRRVKSKVWINENRLEILQNDTLRTYKVVDRYYTDVDYNLHFVLEDNSTFTWIVDSGRFVWTANNETIEFSGWDIKNAFQFLRRKEYLFSFREIVCSSVEAK